MSIVNPRREGRFGIGNKVFPIPIRGPNDRASRPGNRGARPALPAAARIHGELLELGIDVGQVTARKYLWWRPGDPTATWRSFLDNHQTDIVAIDMFVVATRAPWRTKSH